MASGDDAARVEERVSQLGRKLTVFGCLTWEILKAKFLFQPVLSQSLATKLLYSLPALAALQFRYTSLQNISAARWRLRRSL